MNSIVNTNFAKYVCVVSVMSLLCCLILPFVFRLDIQMFLFQILSIFLTITFVLISVRCKIPIQIILLLVALYFLLLRGSCLLFEIEDLPYDGITYQDWGEYISRFDSLYDGFTALLNRPPYDANINDFGYVILISFLYKWFGSFWGSIIMELLKYTIHIVGCFFLYKLSKLVFDKESAIMTTTLWAFNSYIVYFSIANLKEPFFCALVIIATYYMYLAIINKAPIYFCIFIISSLSTFFFRAVFPIYYIFTYYFFLLFQKKLSRRNMSIVVLMAFVLMFTGTGVLSLFFPEVVGLVKQREDTFESNGMIFYFLNILSTYISPFPAFDSSNMIVNLSTVSYSLLNMTFAIFGMLGIYYSIKKEFTLQFPLIMIILFNSGLVIISGFSMNARFTIPIVPLFYSFIPLGLTYAFNRRIILSYLAFVFTITLLYNLR